MTLIFSSSKFTAPLKAASVTLLKFVKTIEDGEQSLIKRIASLFQDHHELQQAIKLIQKHHSVIKQLKKGSQEDQDLASMIEKAVLKYNQLASRTKHRLRPIPAYITFPSLQHHNEGKPFNKSPCVLNPRQMDLFWMKMVRVMNTSRTHLSRVELNTDSQNGSERTFEPLPGEVISFKFDTLKTGVTYSLNSHQTGFPDPALLGGLAFPESFLPQVVLENCPEWILFLKKKAEIATGLLPKGRYNQQAKNLYAFFKEIYQSELPHLLQLHQTFLNTEINASSYDELSSLYRQVNLAYDSISEYKELSQLEGTFSQEHLAYLIEERLNTLPQNLAKQLFLTFLEKPQVEIAVFQQLFFYRLLNTTLTKELLLKSIESYFKTLVTKIKFSFI